MEVTKTVCEPMVGADIEAFLFDHEQRMYVPCVGVLPGTKENPYPLEDLKSGFAVQEDNVMAEFNIPPAKSAAVFGTYVRQAADGVSAMLPDRHSLVFEDCMAFAPEQLSSPQAQLIGCEPDFDAYSGGQMRRGIPAMTNTRGAGGHVHLGGNHQCPEFVAALFADLFIGICSGMGGLTKSDRSAWYGQPGVFRPKPYGIEYRTLGSTWAGNRDGAEYVGHYALVLTRWLSNTDALDIQTVFRKIDWSRIHNYLSFGPISGSRHAERTQIIKNARDAGAPMS
jgi:hypothetical protein